MSETTMFKKYKGLCSEVSAAQLLKETADELEGDIEGYTRLFYNTDEEPVMIMHDVHRDEIIVSKTDWIIEEKEAEGRYYVVSDPYFKKHYKLDINEK